MPLRGETDHGLPPITALRLSYRVPKSRVYVSKGPRTNGGNGDIRISLGCEAVEQEVSEGVIVRRGEEEGGVGFLAEGVLTLGVKVDVEVDEEGCDEAEGFGAVGAGRGEGVIIVELPVIRGEKAVAAKGGTLDLGRARGGGDEVARVEIEANEDTEGSFAVAAGRFLERWH